MAFTLPALPLRLTDANGNILAGAKMYVFDAGTTTPTDCYTSSALSVAHPNPLVADSGGLFDEAFFAAGTYKIRFTTSADATVWEVDNYTVEASGSQVDFPTAVKTANFSVSADDRGTVFLCDASGAPGLNIICSADSEELTDGFPFFVVNIGATGSATIQGNGSQTVDGAASQDITTQYGSVGYVSRGAAGWQSVMKSNLGDFITPVSFASSITFASGSSIVGGPLIDPSGRLTLTSGTAVLTSDVTAATTLYFTPYKGNRIALYNGTGWTVGAFSEVSQALSDGSKSPAAASPSTVYDVFGWLDGTTFRATRGPAWSSATSRGTGAGTSELELLHGVWVNKVAITNGPAAQRGVYLGTIQTSATGTNGQLNMMFAPAAAAGGTANRLDVWNAHNRLPIFSTVRDSTDTWSYATTTWRASNGNNNNRVSFVVGLAEEPISARAMSMGTTSSSGSKIHAGVGYDSTSVDSSLSGPQTFASSSGNAHSNAIYSGFPGIGSHYLQWLEIGNGTASTWYGDNGDPGTTKSGMIVEGRF